MVLMALAMVAILAMAALSIDVVTLYLANAEAQRSADGAALAAARVLSLTGMTGDPSNSAITNRWKQACTLATSVATAVATQNTMGGAAISTSQISVTYPNNSHTTDCTGTDAAFGVNPLVTVKVRRTDLPTFFARMWGRTGATVSATATAEAFNSSNSGNVGNSGASGTITAVQPRCVKPWIVPNLDPGNPTNCAQPGQPACNPLVSVADGSIQHSGIIASSSGTGVIGETFTLVTDCLSSGSKCTPPPLPHAPAVDADGLPPQTLDYLPGFVQSASAAVPACSAGTTPYQEAVAGCDQSTVYQCGIQNGNAVDLDVNPKGSAGDTALGVQCLINSAVGPDTLDTSQFPYKINAGDGNPLVSQGGLTSGSAITASNSIVSLPIYDSTAGTTFSSGQIPVTIVGFLQVFINFVDGNSNVSVTVLNVSGCGNGSAGSQPVAGAVAGTSPVPVRLITYP